MSTPEGSKKRDYSHYDQMSTEELTQLLRLDFQAGTDGDSDLDAILYISDLLARRNGPTDTDAAWEQFQTKYLPYAQDRSLYDLDDVQTLDEARSAAPVRRTRRLWRLAVLAAALSACLLGGMMAAQAAGLDVFGAIARWTDETFFFERGESGSSSSFTPEIQDMEAFQPTLQTLGMADRFPTRHLENFVPGGLQISELHTSVSAHVTFFGEDRTYSVVVQHFTQPDGSTGTFEKDDTPVEEYVHNGQTFYILSNLDSLTATAFDGEYMTFICGVITREEIKEIIDSIPAP